MEFFHQTFLFLNFLQVLLQTGAQDQGPYYGRLTGRRGWATDDGDSRIIDNDLLNFVDPRDVSPENYAPSEQVNDYSDQLSGRRGWVVTNPDGSNKIIENDLLNFVDPNTGRNPNNMNNELTGRRGTVVTIPDGSKSIINDLNFIDPRTGQSPNDRPANYAPGEQVSESFPSVSKININWLSTNKAWRWGGRLRNTEKNSVNSDATDAIRNLEYTVSMPSRPYLRAGRRAVPFRGGGTMRSNNQPAEQVYEFLQDNSEKLTARNFAPPMPPTYPEVTKVYIGPVIPPPPPPPPPPGTHVSWKF